MSVTLKPFSLTLQQFNALRVLASHHPEPIVLRQLTEQMIDKSSNTSRLVDKLSEKNLAVRQYAPDNGRIVHISMTDEGLNLVGQVEESLETNLTTHFVPQEKNVTTELIETLKILRG
jgi:DNA-binding MarR family transcriptional regulator